MIEIMNVDLLFEMELVYVKLFMEYDKVILCFYEVVVDGIVSLIGLFCEIVLYLFEDFNILVIKIVNGENIGC